MQEWYNLFSNSDVYVRHFNSYLVLNISWYQNTDPLCPPNIFFSFRRYSLHVRKSGFRNMGNFCLWNPESLVVESEISLTIGIQNPSSTDKYWNPVSWIRNRESKTVQGSLTWAKISSNKLCGISLHIQSKDNSTSDAHHNLNWLLHLCWSEPERKLLHENEYMYSIALTAILKFNKVTKNFNNVVITKLKLREGRSSELSTFAVAKRKPETKKTEACTGLKPLTSAIPVQCSGVSQWSGVRILYQPEFFFSLSFCNCKSCVTVMVFLHIILHTAVHIYDFHIFITSKLKLWINTERRCLKQISTTVVDGMQGHCKYIYWHWHDSNAYRMGKQLYQKVGLCSLIKRKHEKSRRTTWQHN